MSATHFADLLGIEVLEAPEGRARARLAVRDHLKQPFGIVHGGVYAALAESITSYATHIAVSPNGMVAMGQSNHTSFLRPVTDGHLHAEAVAMHRGRTSWVWSVEIRDDEDRLCSIVHMIIAVRPAPE